MARTGLRVPRRRHRTRPQCSISGDLMRRKCKEYVEPFRVPQRRYRLRLIMPECMAVRANLAGSKSFQRSRLQQEKTCSGPANPGCSIEYSATIKVSAFLSHSNTSTCLLQKYPEVLVQFRPRKRQARAQALGHSDK